MKRKIILIFCMLSMVVSLVSCGKSTNSQDVESTNTDSLIDSSISDENLQNLDEVTKVNIQLCEPSEQWSNEDNKLKGLQLADVFVYRGEPLVDAIKSIDDSSFMLQNDADLDTICSDDSISSYCSIAVSQNNIVILVLNVYPEANKTIGECKLAGAYIVESGDSIGNITSSVRMYGGKERTALSQTEYDEICANSEEDYEWGSVFGYQNNLDFPTLLEKQIK